ncbi:methionyl-tRNA formyltransferase [Prevotella sp. HUN102]|uniref:methionyl-tRNA formyltransferase n=1 Tax=Prevotella sp. HUN102 TaxID=1392486 RepID=UPI00048D4CF4|nr:methionyl-tRNA formyltransferase [Prevotella sp. HUN102]
MNSKDIRIVFMGTPEFAVETLKTLVENKYNVVGVVTQPDKPVGRHQESLQALAVKQYALSVGLPVLQPVKMKDPDFISQLQELNADIFVVVAFRMLPEVVWAMPRLGTFNIHAALLPQYRGAAPINWAVINGEKETGVTTFFLDKDIDTGRIILQKHFPIPEDANVECVYDGLMKLGADIAVETIELVASKIPETMAKSDFKEILDAISVSQDSLDTSNLKHAPKIFKETCEINWNNSAKHINDFVRGLSPYPGAWAQLCSLNEPKTKSSTVLKIFKTRLTDKPSSGTPGMLHIEKSRLFVNTTDSLLELLEVQLSGKKRMDAGSFLNGFKDLESFCLKSSNSKE